MMDAQSGERCIWQCSQTGCYKPELNTGLQQKLKRSTNKSLGNAMSPATLPLRPYLRARAQQQIHHSDVAAVRRANQSGGARVVPQAAPRPSLHKHLGNGLVPSQGGVHQRRLVVRVAQVHVRPRRQEGLLPRPEEQAL